MVEAEKPLTESQKLSTKKSNRKNIEAPKASQVVSNDEEEPAQPHIHLQLFSKNQLPQAC